MGPGLLQRCAAPALWLLMLTLALWAYWPGISGPRMLDDYSSLSRLAGLGETPELAGDYVFGDKSGPLGRPVAMASFVLEKLYFGDSASVSKQINIFLHLATACLVVWLLGLLLRVARLPGYQWLAVLLGAAWLLSPLYVSTTLYIVQRMAMLAAFFSLACCLSYVYWRLALMANKAGLLPLALVFVFAVLAVFSKENAIVLLPVLLLLEVFWLRYEGPGGAELVPLRRFSHGCIFIGIAGALIFLFVGLDWLEGRFARRDFTLWERALTQTRVLWDYVRQVYWPDVGRMGLQHDDLLVSTSIRDPASTLWAIVAWFGVLVACVALSFAQWGRFLVFGIAFFVVAHATESTVWPLELYFEHRNYLPGVGLFLLLAVIFAMLIQRWPQAQVPLLVWLGLYVLYLALQTSSQVQIWSSRPLLYLNSLNGHPNSVRANADMAGHLANLGELKAALAYSQRAYEASLSSKAMGSERPGDQLVRDVAISCMANSPLPPGRIEALGTVRPGRPLAVVSNVEVLVKLLQNDTCPGFDWLSLADRLALIYLVDGHPKKAAPRMYAALASLENELQRYDNAYEYARRLLLLSPNGIHGLMMQLHFTTALGKSAEAQQILEKLRQKESAGRLNEGQRANLSLYREH